MGCQINQELQNKAVYLEIQSTVAYVWFFLVPVGTHNILCGEFFKHGVKTDRNHLKFFYLRFQQYAYTGCPKNFMHYYYVATV